MAAVIGYRSAGESDRTAHRARIPLRAPGAQSRPRTRCATDCHGKPILIEVAPLSPNEIDHRLLMAFRGYGANASVGAAARTLSLSGEHGALWLALGLAGAAADPSHRTIWLRGTALTAGAHLTSIGIKRIVRRLRPRLPGLEPLVRTTGRHSFPSSHASSSAAAAVLALALGPPAAVAATVLATAMCTSRLVLGVHYPTDVAAGAVLGAATARIGARWMRAAAPAKGGGHD